jgi:hypothetical protein
MRAAIIGTLALLAGCAGLPEASDSTPGDDRDAAVLAEIGRALPGDYSSAASREQHEDGGRPLWLSIRRVSATEPARIVFELEQRRGEDPARFFRLGLSPNPDSPGLDGFFAPTDRSGRIQRSCALSISIHSRGFNGLTNPSECRFGEDTGLLKEIAFDGRRLIIGDRLVQLSDGRSRGEDQVLTLYPVHVYSGWAGTRAGEDWHRAEAFRIHSGGDALALIDAAGMPIGVSVELARYTVAGDDTPLLRLRAFDSDSGQILAESWADPSARRLGVALPDFQVGLERMDAERP